MSFFLIIYTLFYQRHYQNIKFIDANGNYHYKYSVFIKHFAPYIWKLFYKSYIIILCELIDAISYLPKNTSKRLYL